MKKIKFLTLALVVSTLFIGCSKDDAPQPEAVNEEEVITTLTVTLVPTDGESAAVTLQTRDLDGDGPDEPVITTGNLVQPDNALQVSDFKVFKDEMLLFDHPTNGPTPDRTYGGDEYYGGFSDHLAVYVEIGRK